MACVLLDKRDPIDSMEVGFYLPKLLIQNILFFMDGKEAAQTCVLSKSWYEAWSTRPTLSFKEPIIYNNSNLKENFRNSMMKSLQRYKELDLRVEKLRLCFLYYNSDYFDEFMCEALKLGVSDFNFAYKLKKRFFDAQVLYVLPYQVLEMVSLMKLHVEGCMISPGHGVDGNVLCSHLVSLHLSGVYIDDDLIKEILFKCHLIEDLYLRKCRGLVNVNVSKLNRLKCFTLRGDSKTSVSVEFKEPLVNGYSGINSPNFCHLNRLELRQTNTSSVFLNNFSSWFPCVGDLNIEILDNLESVRLSSNSLKFLKVVYGKKLRYAKFIVPNICKFESRGWVIPLLSLETSSKDWESCLQVNCKKRTALTNKWFMELKRFLAELRLSKISLMIYMQLLGGLYPSGPPLSQVNVPVVENLAVTLSPTSLACSYILGSFISICRPKTIKIYSQYWESGDYSFTDLLLSRKVLQCVNQNRLGVRSMQMASWMDYLMEINVEFSWKDIGKWQMIPWEMLMGAFIIPEDGKDFRFHLKWEPLFSMQDLK